MMAGMKFHHFPIVVEAVGWTFMSTIIPNQYHGGHNCPPYVFPAWTHHAKIFNIFFGICDIKNYA